ncbi:MAG: hypothetical protein LIP23_02410 [Planctomycetes bacterium]|nr:hypothetical protein [Planctomycetota bacterium]
MSVQPEESKERFQVKGNVLKVTPKFDPRYQSRAGVELINIVSSLAAESQEGEVVLDISEADALPSMMLGILTEARDRTGRAGKKLKIRLKKTTFDRLRNLGLGGVFSQNAVSETGADDLELVNDPGSTA